MRAGRFTPNFIDKILRSLKSFESPSHLAGSSTVYAGIAYSILILLILSLLFTTGPAYAANPVLAVRLDGAITPSSDDVVRAALEEAQAGGYQALIIIMNTPGGGLTETTDIIGQIENTSLPVIGYVFPEGATAWSAGTLILMSTDVAAMSPHTIIGSAQPVSLSATGETIPINDTKTINAIVALIEEKARMHKRNTTAARAFVLENLNLNATDALKYGVVEYVSPTPDDLLRQVDGRVVKNITLKTAGSQLDYFEPPINLVLLEDISDPMIAGLLLLIGLYSLIFGLTSPGHGAEAVGAIMLVLGLIGMGFNVNLSAFVLIAIGAGLILFEIHSHAFGLLAGAGLVCIIIGSILLVPTSYPQWYLPGEYQRSLAETFIVPSLILGAFLAFAVYKVAKIRFAPPVTGQFLGEEAEAIEAIAPRGYVLFQGEYWLAESDEQIKPGEKVVIVDKSGSVLKVRRSGK
jgi:membrane-bound serine protease (ClpP class)